MVPYHHTTKTIPTESWSPHCSVMSSLLSSHAYCDIYREFLHSSLPRQRERSIANDMNMPNTKMARLYDWYGRTEARNNNFWLL